MSPTTPKDHARAATRGGAAHPITGLHGIGARVAERFARLGVLTVEDLLFHLPTRYEDRTRVTPIGTLAQGGNAVIVAEIELAQVRYGRRRSLVCMVADGTGRALLRFFHFNESQRARFTRGTRIRCYGEFRRGPNGLEVVHPEYRFLADDETVEVEAHLTPVYPATEGLNQTALRRFVGAALSRLEREPILSELLPDTIRQANDLPSLQSALAFVHHPPPDIDLKALEAGALPAQRRLAFEELLAHHLSLRLVRRTIDHQAAPALKGDGQLIGSFRDRLGFALTAAQSRVTDEVLADLADTRPMYRLLQGDVGSGKTVVAALACLRAVEAGHQAALMAPTELLAEQHFRNFETWLDPLGVKLAWVAGKAPARARKSAAAAIANGDADIAIGTHALFQDEIRFRSLALIVIDEQHRFGVDQRLALREKGVSGQAHPHQLIMTATPIPRTLAMTAYADLDTSVIDELPPGRTPVETAVVPDHRRDEVVARVHAAADFGQQAYWVCPLIEESDVLDYQAATDTAESLSAALPDLTIGLVHGRLKAGEKDRVMSAFIAHEVNVLVATTVIEVGVDVPNSSLMVIENAERLGLSQLHQLRGRVGRGHQRSVCILLYHAPLSRMAKERLAVIRQTTDGFEIAQRDLELRGPGEVLGTRQTGVAQFRIADLHRDRELLPAVGRAGALLLSDHAECVAPMVQRWLGHAVAYADA